MQIGEQVTVVGEKVTVIGDKISQIVQEAPKVIERQIQAENVETLLEQIEEATCKAAESLREKVVQLY